MARVSDLKNSRFLKKEDVEPPKLVTIQSYEEVNVALEDDKPDMRFILHFRELDKPMVLNITNGQRIEAITGTDDLDNWTGVKIVLYNDPDVSYGGKLTGGIRCRAPKKKLEPVVPKPLPPLNDAQKALGVAEEPEREAGEDDIPY